MMEAFLDEATAHGTKPNQYFDMVKFADYWNAPVEIVAPAKRPALAEIGE